MIFRLVAQPMCGLHGNPSQPQSSFSGCNSLQAHPRPELPLDLEIIGTAHTWTTLKYTM